MRDPKLVEEVQKITQRVGARRAAGTLTREEFDAALAEVRRLDPGNTTLGQSALMQLGVSGYFEDDEG
ncbi:MAG: hypothetical protein RLY93_20465 [Sumerlaeia bacterium]